MVKIEEAFVGLCQSAGHYQGKVLVNGRGRLESIFSYVVSTILDAILTAPRVGQVDSFNIVEAIAGELGGHGFAIHEVIAGVGAAVRGNDD